MQLINTYSVPGKVSPVFLGKPPSTSLTMTELWRLCQNLEKTAQHLLKGVL